MLKETSYLLDISTTWLLVPSIIVIFDGQALYIITHKRAPLLNRRLVTNSILIDYAPENGTARPLSKISVVTMSKADMLHTHIQKHSLPPSHTKNIKAVLITDEQKYHKYHSYVNTFSV